MRLALFFLSVLALIFTACQKEEVGVTDPSEMTLQEFVSGKEEENKEGENCFELVFPLHIIMPDNSAITLNNDADWSAVKVWYETHPDSEEKPTLNYPVDLLFEGGTIKTISNENAMAKVKKYCNKKEKKCFELVYPINIMMPDNSLVTLDSKADWGPVKAWYHANPDVAEKPSWNYPIDIVFEDGTRLTINDEDEMGSAKADCK